MTVPQELPDPVGIQLLHRLYRGAPVLVIVGAACMDWDSLVIRLVGATLLMVALVSVIGILAWSAIAAADRADHRRMRSKRERQEHP
jgi:hypothetical protein